MSDPYGVALALAMAAKRHAERRHYSKRYRLVNVIPTVVTDDEKVRELAKRFRRESHRDGKREPGKVLDELIEYLASRKGAE